MDARLLGKVSIYMEDVTTSIFVDNANIAYLVEPKVGQKSLLLVFNCLILYIEWIPLIYKENHNLKSWLTDVKMHWFVGLMNGI